MILTDDLGFADTSLYGGSIDTPNMLLTRAGTGPAGTTAQLRLNGYRTELVTGSDQVRLSRLDDGAPALVARGTLSTSVQAGTTYRLRTVHAGSRVEVYVDGAKVLSWRDDKPREGGSVGLHASTNATFDNLQVRR
jgi:hypothetical protein